MAGTFGDWLEYNILRWIGRNTDLPAAPDAIFVSLHSADPGDTGASELPSTGSYARVSCATTAAFWNAPVISGGGHRLDNGSIIAFPTATADWNGQTAIPGFGLWDADVTALNNISSVNDTSNELTVTGHGLSHGDAVRIGATGTPPTPLVNTTVYYARVISTDVIKVHLTYADALANTNAVDITNTTTGASVHKLGNYLGGGTLVQSKPVLSGDTAKFAAGSFDIDVSA